MPRKQGPSTAVPKLISASDFELALDGCRAPAPFAIAVSGGPDSVTLMHLAARHCRSNGLALPVVLTVDHGLRSSSAAESHQVARWAAALGLNHHILRWEGPKPSTNVQAEARAARYALIAGALKKLNVWALLTGHTLDDQAETFLMRLGRGSGLDGLGGMAPVSPYPDPEFPDLCLLRPLLGFPKSQILATAESLGIEFVTDPSNQNPAFARTKARKALDILRPTGVTAQRIAEAAAHLRRARLAIEHAELELFKAAVKVSPWGYAIVDTAPVGNAPLEVRLRFTASILRMFGGADYPPELRTVERICDWFLSPTPAPQGRTAAGVRLAALPSGQILVVRELAGLSRDEPVLTLRPGESGIWDGRFRVSIDADVPSTTYIVQNVGKNGAAAALDVAPGQGPGHEPRRVAATFPGVYAANRLYTIPVPGGGDQRVKASFLGRPASSREM